MGTSRGRRGRVIESLVQRQETGGPYTVSMLAKRIIPCLDIDGGRVVKGIRFVSLVDAGDPVEQARAYDAEGADELVFLDITASSGERSILIDLVRRVADEVFVPLTVGGGLDSIEDIRAVLRAAPIRFRSTPPRSPGLRF